MGSAQGECSEGENQAPAPMGNATLLAARLVSALPALKHRACRYAHQPADVDDLVQEALLRAIHANVVAPTEAKLIAWLTVVLRNCHCDRIRKARHEVCAGDRIDELTKDDDESPPERPWELVSDDDSNWALSCLPEAFRLTYRLYAVDGLSYLQIADKLGVTPATVGTRMLRARANLRRLLHTRLVARKRV